MKLSASTILLPVIAGVASGLLVALSTWDSLRAALLPAVSIIAAAVLVRLARGLPFTNPDHFTLEQFRSVSRNLEANARKLRALIFMCLVAIVLLIVGSSATNLLARSTSDWPIVGLIGDRSVSGLIGLSISYAFIRIIEVVHSDLGLLRTQSKILEGVISTKNASSFQKSVKEQASPGIAGADRYGKHIPH